MKLSLPILFALLTLTPQHSNDDASSLRPQAPKDQTALLRSASLIELCNEIEAEQRKSCASTCAATGKGSSYEASICGLGSSCTCL